MAMIKCPECGTEVSDKAEKCPKCAYPIQSTQTEEKTQTIQQTSKKLKKHIIFSVLALIVGVIFLFIKSISWLGVLLIIVGIAWYIITKFNIWWRHK